MTWPVWTVEHREHEFTPVVVGEAPVANDGALINEVTPDNLQFLLQLGKLGPGTIAYDLSLDAKDVNTGDPVVTHDFVGAYRTDFRLKRSSELHPLMAGMHTPAPAGTAGDTPMDLVSLAGQDWLHYLQRRVWPYDADLSYVDWPDGLRFSVAAAEIGDIVRDVLETVRDVSPNWPLPPDAPGTGGHPSYSLGYTVVCDDTGITTNFAITPMDSTAIYDMINTLAQNERDQGGFDFLMTWDKIFKLIYPEIGDPDVPVFTLQVDAMTQIANMREIGFTNTGPEGTHFLGVGSGSSNQAGGVNRHFRANSARYRRLDVVEEYGDVKNLDMLERLTGGSLSTGADPVLEIPIIVDPATIEDFWTLAKPGNYVMVNYELRFHEVASAQKIVSMDCSAGQEGNELVTLGVSPAQTITGAAGLDDF